VPGGRPLSSAAASGGRTDAGVHRSYGTVGLCQCPTHRHAHAGTRSGLSRDSPGARPRAARTATAVQRGGTTGPPAAHPAAGPRSTGLDVSSEGLDPGCEASPGRAQSAHRAAGLSRVRHFLNDSHGMIAIAAASMPINPYTWPVGTGGVGTGRTYSARSATGVPHATVHRYRFPDLVCSMASSGSRACPCCST
jgi:hypothetical protein